MYRSMKKKFLSLTLLASGLLFGAQGATAQTLAEKLGYDKDAILLIINNDDAGMCQAANMGTVKGMSEGLITSETIMFIAPGQRGWWIGQRKIQTRILGYT